MTNSRRIQAKRALFEAAVFLCALALAGRADAGVSLPGAWYEPVRTSVAAPARLSDLAFAADRLTPSERHELSPLSAEEQVELARVEKGRRRVGLVRRFDGAVGPGGIAPAVAQGSRASWNGGLVERKADGTLAWTTSVVSPGAGGVRLLLAGAPAPGTKIYVYSTSGEVHGPYVFDGPIAAEGFWTNTVFASEVFLEAQMPSTGSGGRLSIEAVGHLNVGEMSNASLQSTACFVDASCVAPSEFSNLESASHAVATLLFREGTSFYACSGGLVGSTDRSFQPYLLTAHHCFGTQSSAQTLEAVFNYRNASCNAVYPSISSFPRTLGSTLLATGETSDFTLVRLAQAPPAGSYFLGWSSDDLSRSGGTAIYRLSYPAPGDDVWPQYYSRHTISSRPSPGACSGYAQGNFIYSKDTVGGVAEGSSGSPVFLADGRIVGQLLGACGANTSDDCDSDSNSTVDGAFAVTYPQVAQWLNPTGTGGGGSTTCTPNAATLCLNNGRFKVAVNWNVASQGTGGSGTGVTVSGDTGYFWFFSSGNIELMVKALDGRAVNGYYWIFYGALSDVAYTITVTDTTTGAVKTYSNPQGHMASNADTSAFR